LSIFNELKRRNVVKVGVAYAVSTWILLQLTDVVAEILQLPEWAPKLILLILVVGFVPALIFAWAFEMTPEGIKREKDVDRSQSITPQTGKKLNNTILVLMAVAIAYLLFDKFSEPEMGSEPFSQEPTEQEIEVSDEKRDPTPVVATPVINRQSIAVLPFENFSGDASDQYFADGLADTLLHKLAQISDLKVIARNSSFQYKGTNKDVREIGKALNVTTVLEGSVQRSGEQVRIIAQLINAADGVHLWSQSFDDSMDNIFSLQDRVAADIVEQLQLSLSKEEQERLIRNGTDNPEAYDLLIRALNVNSDLDVMVDARAETWEPIQLLSKAVELDPQYAEAWAYLSRKYNGLAFAADSADDFDRYVSESRRAAEKALALDPNLAKAHEAMGWVEHRHRESLKAARHFRRALELNPNSDSAMSGLGLQIGRTDPEEALRLFTRVLEIDPGATIAYRQKHFALKSLGRIDEAIRQLELGIDAAPDMGVLYNDLSGLLISTRGRPDESARQLSQLLKIAPRSYTGVDAMVRTWTAAADTFRASAWMELLRTGRDDSDEAKLLNAETLLSAAQYDEVLRQLDEVQENNNNEWHIVWLGLAANLGLKNSARAAEYTVQFRAIVNEMKARGSARPSWDAFVVILEMLSREQSGKKFNAGTALGALPPLENLPFLRSKFYLLAGVQARLGDTDKALAHLEQSLEKPGGGVFNRDLFGFSIEQSPLLTPLAGNPAFEDWLLRYRARRDAMLQRMIEMEIRGEIIAPATVARMTQS